MTARQLPALAWPLTHRRWAALCHADGRWQLLPRLHAADPLLLSRVDVVLELDDWLWLRLRWQAPGQPRWWPAQKHVWLARTQQPGQWALLRAALAPGRRRHWFGAP